MLADAEEICDQFGILHDGKIVYDGSPVACLKHFNAKTLEQAYMNCISEVTLQRH
jgi:ABC-2 type transport system ATP-binding protein